MYFSASRPNNLTASLGSIETDGVSVAADSSVSVLLERRKELVGCRCVVLQEGRSTIEDVALEACNLAGEKAAERLAQQVKRRTDLIVAAATYS